MVEVALGQAPADLVIRGACLVNVFTQEVEPPQAVAISQGRVASLGPELPGWLGPDTQVVEAEGGFLLPGLIDAHTHLDSIAQLGAFCPHALAQGNTSAVTELAMMAGAWGLAGVEAALAEGQAQTMRMFFVAPPLVPPFPELESSAGLNRQQFQAVLEHPSVLGVGEAYWPSLVDHDPRLEHRLAAAQALGKTREGHAAGARGAKLSAYAAGGITSCHEAITGPEALERLRLGLAVQVREGFVRREMEEVVPALKDLPDTSRVMLVTDLADPTQVISQGAMNPLLAKAVALGVPPARAVAWCSLNPARYFGLERLGAVAPGYLADLVLVEDLTDFRARQVYVQGRLVAQDGRCLDPAPEFTYPPQAAQTLRCAPLDSGHLRVNAPGPRARVRVIDIIGDTITKEGEAELAVEEGAVRGDAAGDVLKMVHLGRQQPGLLPALGFVRGWGLKTGALALTMLWDNSNLMALGASDAEIMLAANRALELGGGLVVAAGDQILAELAFPIAGITSPLPLPQIVEAISAVEDALAGLGCPLPRPFLTAQTMCFTGLPFLRLTDKGLADVRRRCLVDLLL